MEARDKSDTETSNGRGNGGIYCCHSRLQRCGWEPHGLEREPLAQATFFSLCAILWWTHTMMFLQNS